MAADDVPGPDRPSGADPVTTSLAHADAPLLSVVIPMRNEGPNVDGLLAEIAAALGPVAHEVICVDDGSDDDTGARLAEAAGRFPLRPLRHPRSFGQSAAVVSGVLAARAPWIATLDGTGRTTRRTSRSSGPGRGPRPRAAHR
jgi:dolichol-phosphate mannosyltransferase